MSPSFMLTMSLSYLIATLVRSYDSHDAENADGSTESSHKIEFTV